MATTLPALMAKVSLDHREFDQGIAKVQAGLQKMETSFRNTFNAMENLGKKAAIGFAAVAAAITGATKAAGNFESAMIRLRASVADNEVEMQKLEAAIKRIRAGSGESITTITNVMAQARLMGMDLGLTTDQIIDLVDVSEQLATIWGTDMNSTMQSLMQGLAGATRGLRQFGIQLSDTELQTWAYERGLTRAFETLTETEKAQLRYQAVMEKLAPTLGVAGEAARTFNNSLGRVKNAFIDLAAVVGTAFLDRFKDALWELGSTLLAIAQSPAMVEFIVRVLTIGAAITGAGVAIGIMGKIGNIALSLLSMGFAALTNPILLTAIALGLVLANLHNIIAFWNETESDQIPEYFADLQRAIVEGDFLGGVEASLRIVVGGVKWVVNGVDTTIGAAVKAFSTDAEENWTTMTAAVKAGDWWTVSGVAIGMGLQVIWDGFQWVVGQGVKAFGDFQTFIAKGWKERMDDIQALWDEGDKLAAVLKIGLTVAVEVLQTVWNGVDNAVDLIAGDIDNTWEEQKARIKSLFEPRAEEETSSEYGARLITGTIYTVVMGSIRFVEWLWETGKDTVTTIQNTFNLEWRVQKEAISTLWKDEKHISAIISAVVLGSWSFVRWTWDNLEKVVTDFDAFIAKEKDDRWQEVQDLWNGEGSHEKPYQLTAIIFGAISAVWDFGQSVVQTVEDIIGKIQAWYEGSDLKKNVDSAVGKIQEGNVPLYEFGQIVGNIVGEVIPSFVGMVINVTGEAIKDLANTIRREAFGMEEKEGTFDIGDVFIILAGTFKAIEFGLTGITEAMRGFNEQMAAELQKHVSPNVDDVDFGLDSETLREQFEAFGKALWEVISEGFKAAMNFGKLILQGIQDALTEVTGSEELSNIVIDLTRSVFVVIGIKWSVAQASLLLASIGAFFAKFGGKFLGTLAGWIVPVALVFSIEFLSRQYRSAIRDMESALGRELSEGDLWRELDPFGKNLFKDPNLEGLTGFAEDIRKALAGEFSAGTKDFAEKVFLSSFDEGVFADLQVGVGSLFLSLAIYTEKFFDWVGELLNTTIFAPFIWLFQQIDALTGRQRDGTDAFSAMTTEDVLSGQFQKGMYKGVLLDMLFGDPKEGFHGAFDKAFTTMPEVLQDKMLDFEEWLGRDPLRINAELELSTILEQLKMIEGIVPYLKIGSGFIPEGFQVGGFTENVGDSQIAGVVHGGEWVAPAWMVRKDQGFFQALDRMRKTGYKEGGPVGGFAVGGFAGAGNMVGASLDALTSVITFMTQQFSQIIRNLQSLIGEERANEIIGYIQNMERYVLEMPDLWRTGLTEMSTAMSGAIGESTDAAGGYMSDMIDKLNQGSQKAMDTLNNGAITFDTIMEAAKGNAEAQAQILEQAGNKLAQIGRSILDFIISPIREGFMKVIGPAMKRLQEPLMRLGMILGEVLLPIIEALLPLFQALAYGLAMVVNVFIGLINGVIMLLNALPFVNIPLLNFIDLSKLEPGSYDEDEDYPGSTTAGWNQPITNNFEIVFTGNTILDSDDESVERLADALVRYWRDRGVKVVV